MAAAVGAAGLGGAATNNNISISINSSLCGIYVCDTSSHRRKTNGQILSLRSCPSSSEYDIAKPIILNVVIDEFASVKARKFTL
jgi:hypothetical protein